MHVNTGPFYRHKSIVVMQIQYVREAYECEAEGTLKVAKFNFVNSLKITRAGPTHIYLYIRDFKLCTL